MRKLLVCIGIFVCALAISYEAADGRGRCRENEVVVANNSDVIVLNQKVAIVSPITTVVAAVPANVVVAPVVGAYSNDVSYSYQSAASYQSATNYQAAPQAQAAETSEQHIARLENELRTLGVDVQQVQDQAPATPAQTPHDAPTSGQPATSVDIAARAVQILSQHCSGCHSGKNTQTDFRMFDDNRSIFAKLPRVKIWQAIDSGKMPKTGALTADEKQTIRQWAEPPVDLIY